MIGADGIFLAEADRIELAGGHAGIHQIVLRRLGPGIAQRNVVFGRAALVAIAFNLQFVAGILLQNLRQFLRIRGKRVIASVRSVCSL